MIGPAISGRENTTWLIVLIGGYELLDRNVYRTLSMNFQVKGVPVMVTYRIHV